MAAEDTKSRLQIHNGMKKKLCSLRHSTCSELWIQLACSGLDRGYIERHTRGVSWDFTPLFPTGPAISLASGLRQEMRLASRHSPDITWKPVRLPRTNGPVTTSTIPLSRVSPVVLVPWTAW